MKQFCATHRTEYEEGDFCKECLTPRRNPLDQLREQFLTIFAQPGNTEEYDRLLLKMYTEEYDRLLTRQESIQKLSGNGRGGGDRK